MVSCPPSKCLDNLFMVKHKLLRLSSTMYQYGDSTQPQSGLIMGLLS